MRMVAPTVTRVPERSVGAAPDLLTEVRTELLRTANLLSAWKLGASLAGNTSAADAMRRTERRLLHIAGACGCLNNEKRCVPCDDLPRYLPLFR